MNEKPKQANLQPEPITPISLFRKLLGFEATAGSSDGCYDPSEHRDTGTPPDIEGKDGGYVEYNNGEVTFINDDQRSSS